MIAVGYARNVRGFGFDWGAKVGEVLPGVVVWHAVRERVLVISVRSLKQLGDMLGKALLDPMGKPELQYQFLLRRHVKKLQPGAAGVVAPANLGPDVEFDGLLWQRKSGVHYRSSLEDGRGRDRPSRRSTVCA